MNLSLCLLFVLQFICWCDVALGWKATIYQRTFFNTDGYSTFISGDDKKCRNLDKVHWCEKGGMRCRVGAAGYISSINTLGTCLRLYSRNNCMGRSVSVHPGNFGHKMLSQRKFDKTAYSIGGCFGTDKTCEAKVGFRKRASGHCAFFNDLVVIGTVTGLVLQHMTQQMVHNSPNQQSPIVSFQRGHNQRVEYVDAVITRANLNRGSGTSQTSRNYVHAMGRSNDDAGHIIAQRLGGSGTDTFNLFPQSLNFNRGVYRADIEDLAYREVIRTGRVRMTVELIYDTAHATRPSSILFRIESGFNGDFQYQGDLLNP